MNANTIDQAQPSTIPAATPAQILTILEAARVTRIATCCGDRGAGAPRQELGAPGGR